MESEHLQLWTRIGAMESDSDNVRHASRLPVRAASLPPACSAGKDARRTGSQDDCPTTAPFMVEGRQRKDLVHGPNALRIF